MNHWLTVHHPPDTEAPPTDPTETGIWVPRRWAHKGEQMAVGDGVLIYETQDGPSRVLHRPDGTVWRSHYQKGASGIVAIGRISRLCPDQPVTVAEHDSGERIEWLRLADVQILSRDGLVPRRELNRMLGYKPNAPMLGGGGTRLIPESAYSQIVAAFATRTPI